MVNIEQQRNFYQSAFTDAQMESGLGPLFYKLPTELRFLIFGDCVASGHLQFMRASQVLHNDGQALIFEKGVFRSSFGEPHDDYDRYLSPRARQMIRNIDITIHMRIYHTVMLALNYWTIRAPLLISLRHCEINLKVSCVRQFIICANPAILLACFNNAKKLVERVEIDKKMKLSWKDQDCSCTNGIPCVTDCAVRAVQMCESHQYRLGEGHSMKAEELCLTFERKKKFEMLQPVGLIVGGLDDLA